MNNLTDFIKSEREKVEAETPRPVQNSANVRMSLMALKNAVDGHIPVEGNPILENIKKVDVIAEHKTPSNTFIEPSITNNQPKQKSTQPSVDLNEKEDQFTKDLLMKTRSFVTGGGYVEPKKQPIREEFVQPDVSPYIQPQVQHQAYTPIQQIAKNEVLDALKDTITDLYVKEKVEKIIKDFLTSDEGKATIKSIVVNLFKKK